MRIDLIAAIGILLELGPCLAAQTTAPKTLSRDMVAAHNQARARVGVPSLKWSPKLAAMAQEWADHLLASGRFSHRLKSHYGENLSEIRGGHAKPSEVVADWASEAKDYDASRNACRAGAMCGHYTQVVWRNTSEVGCGVAQRRDAKFGYATITRPETGLVRGPIERLRAQHVIP